MKRLAATVGVVLGLMAGSANAALYSRDNGKMVYDDVLNVTWLANWNMNGSMNWAAADNWAKTLVVDGYSGWRLPSSLNPDGTGPCWSPGVGNLCDKSEMGHMFYKDWGALAGNSYATGTNTGNLALFQNVQNAYYWSATPRVENPDVAAWSFSPGNGYQDVGLKSYELFAVAVRPGDVPEPATLALLSLSLGALVLVGRRRPV